MIDDSPRPLCKIARENGGTVPLDCLFGCPHGCARTVGASRLDSRCNRCGSTDVRWRQQTGQWVLFSNEPGKEHECNPPDADAFEVIVE